jgi:hypothetical protein
MLHLLARDAAQIEPIAGDIRGVRKLAPPVVPPAPYPDSPSLGM